MKYRKRTLLAFVLTSFILTPAFAKIEPSSNSKRIGRIVAQHLPNAHYLHKPLDDTTSHNWFDQFFKTLDPSKVFFYEKDVEKYEKYRELLDDSIKKGDIEVAYDIFEDFKQRVHERIEWAIKRAKQPFDFTVDEEFVIDRKDEPWMKSEEEMNDMWRKRVKNSLLLYQMMDDNLNGKKDKKDITEKEKKAIKDAELFPRKSPVERVVKSYQLMQIRYDELTDEDILELFLSSLTKVYDCHSSYMSPKTTEGFRIAMSLKMQGIGATLQSEQGFVKITSLVTGGPADKSGLLKIGDRIIAVAQGDKEPVDIIDMPLDKAVDLIRGEKGSTVNLTIIDGEKGFSSKPKVISIVRDEIKLKDSETKGETFQLLLSSKDETIHKIIPLDEKNDDPKYDKILKVGVVTVPSFYADFEGISKNDPSAKSVSNDTLDVISKMKDQGVDGIIIDLRYNGGGSLSEAIKMTGLFIPDGPVVQISSSHNSDPRVESDKDGVTFYDGPLVVMQNRASASASEIFAGAIQDYKRGVIVGDEKSHGKGTVQTVMDLDRMFRLPSLFKLPPAGTLKFTIQKFYRITGSSTQKKAVESDIVFPAFTDVMDMGEDTLDYVLDWDEVKSSKFTKFSSDKLHIDELRKRSEERRKKSEKFKELEKEIDEFKAEYNKKTISLNKKKRMEDYKKNEELDKKRLALIAPNADQDEDKKEKKEQDVYLDESITILGDLIRLNNK